MPDIVRTFTTRIESHPALTARAELESRVERKLYAALRSGRKFTGDLAVSFYQQFGISAKTLDGIHRQLKAKLASIIELAKLRAAEIEVRIAAKRKQISGVEKALRRKRPRGTAPSHRLRFALHQHKRRLAILERRLTETKERIAEPRICFGSRKLFDAQHHLADNGLDDHNDWRRAWYAARSAQFFIERAAQSPSGNPCARLTSLEDGNFQLELRLPETLGYLSEVETVQNGHDVVRSTYFKLRFTHGAAEIREALDAEKPLSYRFRRDVDGSWFVSVMLRQELAGPAVADFSHGCLGVDLNADHVALTLVDATGNPLTTIKDAPGRPVVTRRIDLVTYGKTRAQRRDMIRKAAAEVAKLARQLGVPIAAEKLDFARKRAELETAVGKKRARMLSSFAHSSFVEALSRVCVRRSVKLILVNPAYTSIIGLVKFAPRYGSSVHAAAALAIARRAMALSERLPASGEGIPVLLASGDRVTLPRPARIAGRHVWSSRIVSGPCRTSGGAPRGAIERREQSRRRDGDRLAPPLLRPGVRLPGASGIQGLIPRLWTGFAAGAEVRIPHGNPRSREYGCPARGRLRAFGKLDRKKGLICLNSNPADLARLAALDFRERDGQADHGLCKPGCGHAILAAASLVRSRTRAELRDQLGGLAPGAGGAS